MCFRISSTFQVERFTLLRSKLHIFTGVVSVLVILIPWRFPLRRLCFSAISPFISGFLYVILIDQPLLYFSFALTTNLLIFYVILLELLPTTEDFSECLTLELIKKTSFPKSSYLIHESIFGHLEQIQPVPKFY